ncbi:hypothetical protein C0989_011187 [Termitomyces sp. Mn162]|nr:hypothetical protein C0989_011187 [Termitomyces sp. Mn162]
MADGQLLFDFFCIKTTRETLALHVQRRYLLFLLKIIAFVDNRIDLRKKSGLGIKRVAAYWKEYIGPPLIPERLKMYTAAIESSPLRGFEDISDERVKLDHLKDRYHEEVVKYAMSKLELRLEDTRDKSCNYPLKELIPPLAVRVDLTFQSNRDEAVFLEGLSVASLPKHRQYLRGEYPSKPFVAEAVARAIFEWCHTKGLGGTGSTLPLTEPIETIIATYKTNIPSAILQWLDLGLIDKELERSSLRGCSALWPTTSLS